MSVESVRASAPAKSRFWSVTWPSIRTDDSEALRRNKLGVRGLNGVLIGMIALLLLVMAQALTSSGRGMQFAAAGAAAVAYLVWALQGISPVIAQLLRSSEPGRAAHWPPSAWPGTAVFFLGELALAICVIIASLPVNPAGILRIVLLPVLAHAVIFLPWRGVALIAAACAGIYHYLLARPEAGGGPIGFLIEATFTVVCMHMVVSTQKARAEVERMAAELAVANRHLGAYATQAEELAAARERNHLAREIHDSLGHYLTVVRVQLEAALALQSRGQGLALDAVQKAQALVGEGLREIRNSVSALRAAPLERRTLCEALLALVAESEASGLKVKMEVQGKERDVSAAAGLTLYRAAQEGLTNVRKHAPGARAHLALHFHEEGNVSLSVSDNGPGSTSTDGGFGLLGLRERAALLNGTFTTRTAPGEGFSLAIQLPE